jgi:hypothetical protein
MSNLIQSLDAKNKHNVHLGENHHIQYSWADTKPLDRDRLKELFSQFYFQLVRTKNTTDLESKLIQMLRYFKTLEISSVEAAEKEGGKSSVILPGIHIKHPEDRDIFENLYKLIGYTRDIVNGKGEYTLTYMQIWIWYQFFPDLACFAILHLVYCNIFGKDTSKHPYGSWKDIKYLCQYVRERTENPNHMLIIYATDLMAQQIMKDEEALAYGEPISLAGKWCPREKSKFNWVFKLIAQHVFKHYFSSASGFFQQKKAFRKAYTHLRKMIAGLNKHLDTTQIHMCNHTWSDIDFNKVTSITMQKQRNGFLNVNYKGKQKYALRNADNQENTDRIDCREHLLSHIQKMKDILAKKKMGETISADEEKHVVHGKRVSMYDFVKDADDYWCQLYGLNNSGKDCHDEIEDLKHKRDMIHLQWMDNGSQNSQLSKFIPLVDTSGSMSCDNFTPLYNAIGLGIRMSEVTHPVFRNRIMTFSAVPTWVQLEDSMDFIEKVKVVRSANWGMNTNFYAAMKLILNSIVEEEMDPADVEGMVLAVFSDMQMDQADVGFSGDETLYENIKELYHEAGLKTKWKAPYKPPHILFWNLRKTDGFPVLSNVKNVTTMCGYNPVMMNAFCNNGMEALKDFTPYTFIRDILSHERYKVMEKDLF